VNLRPAGADDVPAVSALEAEVFGPDAWSAPAVLEELTGPGRTAVVATDEDETLAGYAVGLLTGDVVDLQRIVVAPRCRRRGLARTLLAAVTRSTYPTMLEVSAANEAARAFYTAEGFVEIHRRRRYYRDGTDAVVMRRDPGPPGTMTP
jgi:[ribosomal protein S18]-alanine N-acetyltransferase